MMILFKSGFIPVRSLMYLKERGGEEEKGDREKGGEGERGRRGEERGGEGGREEDGRRCVTFL